MFHVFMRRNKIFEQNPFYHRTIKNTIIAFGNLFTGMTIRHFDKNNVLEKVIRCPIAYAKKEKWFQRLQADPEFAKMFSVDLPRLSFEITSYTYDAERKVGSKNAYIPIRCNGTSKLYSPVPWTLAISLYSYTKTQDEALQVLEQILPFFGPNLIINTLILKDDEISQDIPINLISVDSADNYEGDLTETRMIIQQFNFTAKIDLYGPTSNNYNVIKQTIVDINTNKNINSDPLATHNSVVVPRSADKTGIFTIDESWS